jgi:hypothetical protein
MVISDNSDSRSTIQAWIEKWHPVAAQAVQAFAPVFDGTLADGPRPPLDDVPRKLGTYYRDYLSSMGLHPSRSA